MPWPFPFRSAANARGRGRAPAPSRQPGPRHNAFWDLLGRLGRFLLHLCGLGLCLVHLRLRPGLGCVALGLALLLLGLALAPEVRVVRQVADGFLDLALGLFEDTHLCALSSWLVGKTGTSTRRPEERKRSSVTFRNALLPVFVVVGRSLGLLDGVGLGDLESEMGPFRRWWLANRLGLFDGVGLGDVES